MQCFHQNYNVSNVFIQILVCFEWEFFHLRSGCVEEGCVPTMSLNHAKRYSLEEAIYFIVGSPNKIEPSTATPITESESFVTDACAVTSMKANDAHLERSVGEENRDNEDENLNFFSISAINTMFTDASTLIQNVDDLFNPTFDKSGSTEHSPASTKCDTMELDASTSCNKATMTDYELNHVSGIAQVPHKQISSTMMESESSCDETEKNDLSTGQNGHRNYNPGEDESLEDDDDLVERIEQEQDEREQVAEAVKEPPVKRKKLSLLERKQKAKEKHSILPRHNCKHKCKHQKETSNGGAHDESCLRCEDIDEETRIFIHEEYWKGEYSEKTNWIASMVDLVVPKRRRKDTVGTVDRMVSNDYHLYTSTKERVKVCQKMFTSTLGYSSDKVVRIALGKSKCKIFTSPDKRGHHPPHNKLMNEKVELIRQHILSYNPSITHYRRKHAPNRLYISPAHSTASMLQDFNETYNTNISKSRYYKEIKDMNISFVKLGEEECEDCDLHDKHLTDDHGILDVKERSKTDPDTKKSEKITIAGCEVCFGIFLSYAVCQRKQSRVPKR